ncbi:hypothetical protein NECHADRAFT_97374 [Paecilomyces variotii No. 5]|uniref:Alcohol dehydrogenase-like N-terminal domain-containing protein n=1 Tax=Byssochlamys spectabilis (strain No. 5 / NBRC 109023) TaxID=1356009 RepID=V5I1H0_BYSSN|nr:hypothetical protein NECHADRAFT_97374 [Paecilomyces variotii No. 5]
MFSQRNKAIYLDSQGNYSVRVITESYIPHGSQSLVKVNYSAINPADVRHYHMGMSEFVAGYEFVRTVLETGPESPFKVGNDVFGFAFPGDHRPLHVGAHQGFLLAEPSFTYKRPKDMDPITAVTMIVGAMTAIDALFNMLGFGLPAAGLGGKSAANVPILIWGGSSVALFEIGATQCFEYRSPTVVDDIRTAMTHCSGKLTHVFDAVTTGLGVSESPSEGDKIEASYALSSPALARQCCDPDTPDSELHLCASLAMPGQSLWKFALVYRTVETMDHGVGLQDWDEELQKLMEDKVRDWGSRSDRGIRWLIANHAIYSKPPRTRIVHGAKEGIQAIHDVWNGKISREKVVISRPL